jgi:hypothetical protein
VGGAGMRSLQPMKEVSPSWKAALAVGAARGHGDGEGGHGRPVGGPLATIAVNPTLEAELMAVAQAALAE